MISIGLDLTELAQFFNLLRSAHFMGVQVRLLDLDHNYREDLTQQFMEGSVAVDADAETTRGLDITFLDPQKQIQIDPDSPSPTSVYVAQMLQVHLIYQTPTRSWTVGVPVFTGPIDSVDRDDVFLNVKCLGKDSLGSTNLWSGKTYQKGQRKTSVIRDILETLMGENKLDLVSDPASLPNDLKLNREDAPFAAAKSLAGTMGYQLFYDGRGICRMRKRSNNVAMTLDNTWLTSQPSVSYDLQETVNAVDVKGKKPKKGKDAPRYKAIADFNHPLSPWRLGRNGVPRYLWTEVEDDNLRSEDECKDVADRILKRGLLAGVEVQASGVPCSLLEEEDVVTFTTSHVRATVLLRKFTIPLEAGDDASYGYHERSKVKGGHRGVKRKNKKHKGGKGKHKHNQKHPHKGGDKGKGGGKGHKGNASKPKGGGKRGGNQTFTAAGGGKKKKRK
jgi:hypothetical protein